MYNPIEKLSSGDQVYNHAINNWITITRVIKKYYDTFGNVSSADVYIRGFGDYRISYCYYSLAYGPYHRFDPILPDNFESPDHYFQVSDHMNRLTVI